MDWLSSLGLMVEKTVASNGFSLFGLMPGLKNIWKNMFGHQIVYVCYVKRKWQRQIPNNMKIIYIANIRLPHGKKRTAFRL